MSPEGRAGPPVRPAAASDPTVSADPERVRQDAARIADAGPLHLLAASARAAGVHMEQVGHVLHRPWVRVSGWHLAASQDPAEALRLALRDAVVFQRRRLARVFGGRITRLSGPGGPGARSPTDPTNVPASLLEVELETEQERRSVHLESVWAWNLQAAGARVGDHVQIDMQDPLVTIVDGTKVLEGRVLDEREHLMRVPLGALDRAFAWSPGPGEAGPQEGGEDEALVSRAVRSSARLLSTGERSPTGAQARVRTDAWVRRLLGENHASLVPGVVWVVDAGRMPEPACGVLHAALDAAAAPGFVLCEAGPDRFAGLEERFPQADRLDRVG